jgi:methyl coenzyme M reductase subunit D
VRKLNILILIFISVFFGTGPAFAEGMITGEIIQVQGIKETLTEGVYIGNIAIALMEDRKFEIKPIDKVIGHMINSETSINYMGFIVHTVTVLGYDGMKVGVMVYSEDDGIIDYHTISLKK